MLVNALTHGNELCGMVAATHLLDQGVRPAAGTLTVSFANAVHLVMPGGLGSGTPVIQHGRHGQPDGSGVALVAECGQHFLRATADLALEVTLDFLAHFGMIERERKPREAQRRFELLQTVLIRTPEFRFVRPVVGFEEFGSGELIATDGPAEIRSPCDRCTIFMPARAAIVGREAVYLTRPL